MKYEKMCNAILEGIGGKENIKNCFHCYTRLRIEVKDISQVDMDALEKIEGILKIIKVNTQIQCVIGTQVNDVYEDFCNITGMDKQETIDENKNATDPVVAHTKGEKKKITPKSILNAIVDAVSGCIQPLLPGIICAGMIKMLVSLLGSSVFGIFPDDGNVMTVLTLAGDAAFYFLPVMLGYTGAKKFGGSTVTGMIMGAILIHPTLVALVTASTGFTVFGVPMMLVNYSSTVVPMILITWVMSYVEKFFNKIIPNMLKMMLVAPFTILVMLPIGLCGLAPLGTVIGGALSTVILGIPNVLGPIGIGIIAAIYMLLVMTGMHLPVIMAIAVTYFTVGHENVVLVAGAMASMSVAGMCLGFFIRAKKPDNKTLGLSSFSANILGGVSEPAIFGICLKYRRTLVYQMMGAFAGGVFAGVFNVGVYTITSGNFLAFMGFAGSMASNLILGIIALIISFCVAFAFTLILGFKEEPELFILPQNQPQNQPQNLT